MAAVAGSVIVGAGVAARSGGDTTPDASAVLARSAATVTKTVEPAGGASAQSTVTATGTATETVKKRVLKTVTATVTKRAKSSNLVGGGGGNGTDSLFSYCYEAIDAGYGPYVRGVDPECDSYRDADGDGVVCES